MKATLALIILGVLLAAALLHTMVGDHTTFSRADEIRLEDAHPGGVFLDDHTYRSCERGFFAKFLADGTYVSTNQACWR